MNRLSRALLGTGTAIAPLGDVAATIAARDAVLARRYLLGSVTYDITVWHDECQRPGLPYHAVAHVADRYPHARALNGAGLSLKAFGRTPEKAADYLIAALKRRAGRASARQ